jgi:alpha-1,3-rhamnosyl/mannosyltransferase
MTLEIARAAQQALEIERVALLLGDNLVSTSILEELSDEGLHARQDDNAPAKIRPWRVAIGQVPGVQALRRLKNGSLGHKIKGLNRESGKRLVYHEPNMIAQALAVPTVVTMNDLSWVHHPNWHPKERLDWIERNIARTLRQATRFVAISEFTKAAMIGEFCISADRIDVVPLAPASEFVPVGRDAGAAVLHRYGLTDRQYVFSTSTLEPRKNFDRLLAAYLRLPERLRQRVPLVIAGGQGWGDVLNRADAQRAIAGGMVRMLGHVPDGDLPTLCARASVVAYVSLYEGFGLPAVEAMATGVAVLASETTAVGELAFGAAALVNPLDVVGMAARLQEILEDEEFCNGLRVASLERAVQYSWDKTITQLQLSWRRALD